MLLRAKSVRIFIFLLMPLYSCAALYRLNRNEPRVIARSQHAVQKQAWSRCSHCGRHVCFAFQEVFVCLDVCRWVRACGLGWFGRPDNVEHHYIAACGVLRDPPLRCISVAGLLFLFVRMAMRVSRTRSKTHVMMRCSFGQVLFMDWGSPKCACIMSQTPVARCVLRVYAGLPNGGRCFAGSYFHPC